MKHTKETNITMRLHREHGVQMYYLNNTQGAEDDLDAEGNAQIFAEALNVTNETGLTPRQLHEAWKDLSDAAIIDSLKDAELEKLKQERDQLKEALEAIQARINGEWDNPALVKLGPLFPDAISDIERIVEQAIAKTQTP